MGARLDRHVTPTTGRRRARSLAAGACLVAALACWQPVAAADEPAAGAQMGAADEAVPHEYSSALIQWDSDAETYFSGEETGTFAYLLSLPEATGWQFVTILTESWTETTVGDQAAWDVFRWRAIYRRPFEPGDVPSE